MSLESVSEVAVEGDGVVNFFIAKLKDSEYRERCILRAGTNVSYQSFERGLLDSGLSCYCSGEGRLKVDRTNKTIIIYSSPGPGHKITYGILKAKYPDYSSIIWRDGQTDSGKCYYVPGFRLYELGEPAAPDHTEFFN